MARIRLLFTANYTDLDPDLDYIKVEELTATKYVSGSMSGIPDNTLIYVEYNYTMSVSDFKTMISSVLTELNSYVITNIGFLFHCLPTGRLWIPFVNLPIESVDLVDAICKYTEVTQHKAQITTLHETSVTQANLSREQIAELYKQSKIYDLECVLSWDQVLDERDIGFRCGIIVDKTIPDPINPKDIKYLDTYTNDDDLITDWLKSQYQGSDFDVATKIANAHRGLTPILTDLEIPLVTDFLIKHELRIEGFIDTFSSGKPARLLLGLAIQNFGSSLDTNQEIQDIVNDYSVSPCTYYDLVKTYGMKDEDHMHEYLGLVTVAEKAYIETGKSYQDFVDVCQIISQRLNPTTFIPIDLLGCGISRDIVTFNTVCKKVLTDYKLALYASTNVTLISRDTGETIQLEDSPLARMIKALPDIRTESLTLQSELEVPPDFLNGQRPLDHLNLFRYLKAFEDLSPETQDLLRADLLKLNIELSVEDIVRKYALDTEFIHPTYGLNVKQPLQTDVLDQIRNELVTFVHTNFTENDDTVIDMDQYEYMSKERVRQSLLDKKSQQPFDAGYLSVFLDYYRLRKVMVMQFKFFDFNYFRQSLRDFNPETYLPSETGIVDLGPTNALTLSSTIAETLLAVDSLVYSEQLFMALTSSAYYTNKFKIDQLFEGNNPDFAALATLLGISGYTKPPSGSLEQKLRLKISVYQSLFYYDTSVTLEALSAITLNPTAREVIKTTLNAYDLPDDYYLIQKMQYVDDAIMESGYTLKPASLEEMILGGYQFINVDGVYFKIEFTGYGCKRNVQNLYFEGLAPGITYQYGWWSKFKNAITDIGKAVVNVVVDVAVTIGKAVGSAVMAVLSPIIEVATKIANKIVELGESVRDFASALGRWDVEGMKNSASKMINDGLKLASLVLSAPLKLNPVRLMAEGSRAFYKELGVTVFDNFLDIIIDGSDIAGKVAELPLSFTGAMLATTISGDRNYLKLAVQEAKDTALTFAMYMQEHSTFFGIISLLDPTGIVSLMSAIGSLITSVDTYVTNKDSYTPEQARVQISLLVFSVTKVVAAVIKCATFFIPGLQALKPVLDTVVSLVAGLSGVGSGITKIVDDPSNPAGYIEATLGGVQAGIGAFKADGLRTGAKLADKGVTKSTFASIKEANPGKGTIDLIKASNAAVKAEKGVLNGGQALSTFDKVKAGIGSAFSAFGGRLATFDPNSATSLGIHATIAGGALIATAVAGEASNSGVRWNGSYTLKAIEKRNREMIDDYKYRIGLITIDGTLWVPNRVIGTTMKEIRTGTGPDEFDLKKTYYGTDVHYRRISTVDKPVDGDYLGMYADSPSDRDDSMRPDTKAEFRNLRYGFNNNVNLVLLDIRYSIGRQFADVQEMVTHMCDDAHKYIVSANKNLVNPGPDKRYYVNDDDMTYIEGLGVYGSIIGYFMIPEPEVTGPPIQINTVIKVLSSNITYFDGASPSDILLQPSFLTFNLTDVTNFSVTSLINPDVINDVISRTESINPNALSIYARGLLKIDPHALTNVSISVTLGGLVATGTYTIDGVTFDIEITFTQSSYQYIATAPPIPKMASAKVNVTILGQTIKFFNIYYDGVYNNGNLTLTYYPQTIYSRLAIVLGSIQASKFFGGIKSVADSSADLIDIDATQLRWLSFSDSFGSIGMYLTFKDGLTYVSWKTQIETPTKIVFNSITSSDPVIYPSSKGFRYSHILKGTGDVFKFLNLTSVDFENIADLGAINGLVKIDSNGNPWAGPFAATHIGMGNPVDPDGDLNTSIFVRYFGYSNSSMTPNPGEVIYDLWFVDLRQLSYYCYNYGALSLPISGNPLRIIVGPGYTSFTVYISDGGVLVICDIANQISPDLYKTVFGYRYETAGNMTNGNVYVDDDDLYKIGTIKAMCLSTDGLTLYLLTEVDSNTDVIYSVSTSDKKKQRIAGKPVAPPGTPAPALTLPSYDVLNSSFKGDLMEISPDALFVRISSPENAVIKIFL